MGRISTAHKAPGRTVAALKAIDRCAEKAQWLAKLLLVLACMSVVWFALDRDPLFEVLSVEPAHARPGEVVIIKAEVRRDADRGCSAAMTQFLFDSDRKRFDLGSSVASAELIRDIETYSPGLMLMTLTLPRSISYGQADLVSVINYRCNKVHALWPIEVTTHIPFTVIP